MPKYSTKRPEHRWPSDGAVSLADLSEELVGAGTAGGDGPQTPSAHSLSFLVADLDKGCLRWLIEGQAVNLSDSGRRFAVRVQGRQIGFAPSRFTRQLRAAMATGRATAWISELVDEAVRVTVHW